MQIDNTDKLQQKPGFFIQWKEKLIPAENEKEDFYGACAVSNIQHLRWASWFIMLLSIIHIVLFASKLNHSDPVDYQWRKLVIGGHIVLLTYFVLYQLFTYFLPLLQKIWSGKTGGVVSFLMLLLAGAYFASVDQLVTSSITPVFVVTITAPLLILIRPQYSLALYISFFIFFIILVNIFQNDTSLLLTNIVNTVTVSFVGFFFSVVFWVNRLSLYRNTNKILDQQQSLESANNSLLDLTRDLELSNSQKDRVLSVIAHDLRSPFNTLIGTAELLTDQEYELSKEEEAKLKQNLLLTSRNTYMLVDNLLEWASLQQKTSAPDLQNVKLVSLIRELFSELAIVAQSKRIRLSFKGDADVHVLADPVMLASVMRNLLTNAIKFSNKGAEVIVEVSVDLTNAVISVIDTGLGIEKSELEKWTQGGMLSGRVGTANEPSTGLGLSIVNDMLQLNKGKLLIESTPGKGSRFSAVLPLLK